MPPTAYSGVIEIPSSPDPVRAKSARQKASSSHQRVKGKNTRGQPSTRPATSKRTSIIDLSVEDDDDEDPLATAGRAGPHLLSTEFTFSAQPQDMPNPFSERLPKSPPQTASEIAEIDLLDDPAEDPTDRILASIVEILPDVLPAHALMLIRQLSPTYGGGTVHAVVQYLFDHPDYPKVKRDTGKRKRDDVEEDTSGSPSKKNNTDYASTTRRYPPGANYSVLAEEQLFEDFPLIPRPYIRKAMLECKYFYAPSHLRLLEDSKADPLPYPLKRTPHNSKKGKGKAMYDADFEAEHEWLQMRLAQNATAADAALAERLNGEEYATTGEGIECGCCFGEYPFDNMVQCAEGHLFCRDCARRNAEEQIGNRKTDLLCMDQSSCPALFPESEIARFLPEKTLALYHRIKQGKEIEKAGLEGLEGCPFCDYACVIENEEEKLFRCQNDDCLAVSCRKCKKHDHLPRSCKEVEEDSKLNARHLVEEAMTNALMRKCPRCQYAFVKEQGCNKMTCPQCRTLSCYVCRQIINGYDHFNQAPPYNTVKDPNKCPLWDSNLDKLHADEVAAAARKAQEEILASRRDGEVALDAKDLEVELPKAPPTPNTPGPGQPGYNGGPIPGEYLNGFVPFPHLAPLQHRQYHDPGIPAARHHVHVRRPAIPAPEVHFRPMQLQAIPDNDGQVQRWREAQAQAQEQARARAEQIRARAAELVRAREQQRVAQRQAEAALAERRAQAQAKAAARAVARAQLTAARRASWRP